MNTKSKHFTCLSILFLGFFSFQAQIINQENKAWQKAKPEMSRNTNKCDKESLLNFHCNIREQISQPIKYNKDNSQTLIVVHNSNEEENIWNNKDVIAELNSNSYKSSKNGKSITLRMKPSIFSYLGSKNARSSAKDTISVRLKDTNLYE